MKYVVMIYGADAARRIPEVKTELAATGELVSAEELQLPSEGRIVRIRDDAPAVTAGPFVPTDHQVSGMVLIDVADDDRAAAVAARISALVGDRVELRGTLISA
ncbi:YciI family protein [Kribbella sp. NPDC049174]|uniref:YciI family protein n=1 Tax=Kribbella sp. NPDC049174 TaxID=3364112 RepID=UPI0037210228